MLERILLWIFGSCSGFQWVFPFPHENQSRNYIARDLARLVLDILPSNAVFFSENGDNTFFRSYI